MKGEDLKSSMRSVLTRLHVPTFSNKIKTCLSPQTSALMSPLSDHCSCTS